MIALDRNGFTPMSHLIENIARMAGKIRSADYSHACVGLIVAQHLIHRRSNLGPIGEIQLGDRTA